MRIKTLKAAMRVCDLWGDGESARQAMRADVANNPDEDLKDLYEHFVSSYGAFKGMPAGYLKNRVERIFLC